MRTFLVRGALLIIVCLAFVGVVGAQGGVYVPAITDFSGTVHSPAWSPDAKFLAFILDTDDGSQVMVYEIASGENFLVHDEFEKYAGLSWSE